MRFNPRARGGRDVVGRDNTKYWVFQSTRPRGARRWLDLVFDDLEVSIHAPAGGATICQAAKALDVSFNPRARGGRDALRRSLESRTLFQSTRPRGARLVKRHDDVVVCVSIHAPAGGATDHWADCVRYYGFNPRARGGRDDYDGGQLSDVKFQSTRPRGARHDKMETNETGKVSIHAPAGGATGVEMPENPTKRFNPRARGGRDPRVFHFLTTW